MSNVAELIQQLAGTFNKDFVEMITCTVDSVDEDAFTCSCTPISGVANTNIPNVKLNAEANDGFTKIPAIGSTVVVANSTRNQYYVYMYSDIDAIVCIIDGQNSYRFDASGFVWNDGNFGGMAKTGVISTKLNTVETAANQLKTAVIAINSAASGSPGTPVTNAILAGFFASVLPALITLTTQAEISDNKIQH